MKESTQALIGAFRYNNWIHARRVEWRSVGDCPVLFLFGYTRKRLAEFNSARRRNAGSAVVRQFMLAHFAKAIPQTP